MNASDLVVEREKLQFRMSRLFNASPQSLWKAMTQADLIPKWWGPAKYTTVVEKLELRVGGAWRFIQTDATDGSVHVFNGVYKEIVPAQRLVYTFEYEPFAGHVSTDAITLEALAGGRTRVTTVTSFDNLEDLDGMLQSGMEGGANEAWDRLETLAQTV